MSLTAVVTNHDYEKFLHRCLDSAVSFCDEILFYDDGSTDGSLDIAAEYGATVIHRDEPSGSPMWGSNLGIQQARTTHLLFLDADNFLCAKPPENDVDYTFGAIRLVDQYDLPIGKWEYPYWPLTADGCKQFCKMQRNMPFPWGGVWRTSFLQGKRWQDFDSTPIAGDFRTALEWVRDDPTLAYDQHGFLCFRMHGDQFSAKKRVYQAEADMLIDAL